MLEMLRAGTRKLIDASLPKVIHSVRRQSLTYLEASALLDLYKRIQVVERRGKEGILIEAGCALGGSAIVMAAAKSKTRPLFLYDVFDMIPPPSAKDGEDVMKRYEVIRSGEAKGINGNVYYGYQEDLLGKVKDNFRANGVAVEENHVHIVKGLFQETLRVSQPVALAHIDGDWYDSVLTCLQRIEPYLLPGGVLVIDDYDAWSGCRDAVDDHFRDKRERFRFVRKSRLHVVKV